MEERNKMRVHRAGGLADRLMVPALVVGALLTTGGFLMAFLFVAPVNGAALEVPELVNGVMVANQQLLSQKIFYFHMPVAIVSFLALAFAAAFAIRFLMTRDRRYDTSSRVGMEIALLFVIFTMVTGGLWTRFEWGVWWTWEPRLTTYLILMLIVIAYFVLRNAVDDPERRATYASVVSVIALVDVPICFMVTRLIPSSIHPVVAREGGMAPDMAVAVFAIMIGMLLVAYGLYRLRLREARLNERLQALKEQLED